MKQIRFVVILILMFLLCKDLYSQNKLKTETLKHSSYRFSQMARPMFLKSIPEYNMLLVGDVSPLPGNFMLHAFTLDSIKPLGSFIKQGRGKGEIEGMSGIQYFRGDHSVYIFDIQRQDFNIISLDSMVKGSSNVVTGFISQGKVAMATPRTLADYIFMRPLLLPSSWNIVDFHQNVTGENVKHLDIYAPTRVWLKSAGEFPKTPSNLPVESIKETYYGFLSLSESGDCIIYHCIVTNLISVYDTTGKLMAKLVGSPNEYQSAMNIADELPIPENRGYTGLVTRMNKNEIFALNGYPKRLEGEAPRTNLYRFDKKLKPGKRYILETGIFNFDIDWKKKRILALGNDKTMFIYPY